MLPGPYRVPAYDGTRARRADEQDAVRDVPRPRPLRGDVRARAAARRGRGRARHRPRRAAPAQPPHRRRPAAPSRPARARPRRSTSTSATSPACSTPRSRRPATRTGCARRPRRGSRAAPSGPASRTSSRSRGGGGFERARVSVDERGRVRVAAGGATLGQGIETVLAQVAADQLGVDPADVEVTRRRHRSRLGRRRLVGEPLDDLRRAAPSGSPRRRPPSAPARSAAELLEAAPADIRLEDGRAVVAGSAEPPRRRSPRWPPRATPRAPGGAARSPGSPRRGRSSTPR